MRGTSRQSHSTKILPPRVLPLAEAQGILTDEDVFADVS
jgi:hypothetical protein